MLEKEPKNPPETDAAQVFEAISHPVRIQILRLLNESSLKFSDLKKVLGIKSGGNISHHLSKLENLIVVEQDGSYSINGNGKEALFAVDAIKRSNRDSLVKSYLIVCMTIFYGVGLTLSYYSESFSVWNPVKVFVWTFIYAAILYIFIRKQIKNDNWDFVWGPKKKSSNKE